MQGARNANRWVLLTLALVMLLVGYDIVSRSFRAPAKAQHLRDPKYVPDFQIGEHAPDFALPDSRGSTHRLSEIVHRDTILCFSCGCSNCLDVQTYLGILLKRMGTRAPEVITVTTMPRDREETWFRDTQLKQTLLYERKEGPVVAQYRGHPCPRIFRLDAARRVTWIGRSPGEVDFLQIIGNEMAQNLGFPAERPLETRGTSPESAGVGSARHQ